MKNLGKKAVHGAPGKAASMKKAGHGTPGKAASMKKADVPGEWLYLAPETVGVRQIADVLEGTCEMEIWQEAGVLEIMYGGEASMDMEEGKIHPRDQVTAVFAEEHGCNRVYLVTFSAEEYEKVLPVMRHILQECGGIFCGDTEDFKPILTE